MKIQILGTGCPKCRKLGEVAEKAANELGIEFDIEKVTSIDDIIGYGVMLTPGLVVDGVVKTSGKVPSLEEMKEVLK